MKRILGSLIVLSALFVYGEDFRYDIRSDTNDTYVLAPVHIDVELEQTNSDIVLLFEFEPKKSDAYDIVQIDAEHDDTPHHTHHRYRYELYPKHSGDIDVRFKLVKRVTDDKKLLFSASGDRDDYKKLETVDTPIALPPLTLHIRPLPKETTIVGAYRVETDFDTAPKHAYEPIVGHITFKGKGYPPTLAKLYTVDANVSILMPPPQIKRILSAQGIFYEARYDIALSAPSSFELAPNRLHAYNPFTKRFYDLTLPAYRFEIKPVTHKIEADTFDSPPPLRHKTDESDIVAWLGYLFAYLAGAASVWLWRRFEPVRKIETQNPLRTRIDACKTRDELYRLLLANDAKRFRPVIVRIEREEGNLASLKAQAKEIL